MSNRAKWVAIHAVIEPALLYPLANTFLSVGNLNYRIHYFTNAMRSTWSEPELSSGSIMAPHNMEGWVRHRQRKK